MNIKKKLITLTCLIVAAAAFSTAVHAFKWHLFAQNGAGQSAAMPAVPTPVKQGAQLTQYMSLPFPPVPAVNYPVYVYQAQAGQFTQIAISNATAQVPILGEYVSGQTNAAYYLYYSMGGNQWAACRIVLSSGSVNNQQTTCPGVVINPPPKKDGNSSNIWSIAFQTPWPTPNWVNAPMSPTTPPNPNNPYAKPQPGLRTITFYNNTPYSSITIGETCTPPTQPAKSSYVVCQTGTVATIAKKASQTFKIDNKGLSSARFYVTEYVSASGATVKTGDELTAYPYATLAEFTWNSIDSLSQTNLDTSAVDGFNFGIKIYPTPSGYCTYTIGEIVGVSEAGLYNAQSPMASLTPAPGNSLQDLCQAASQSNLTVDGFTFNLNLPITSGKGDFKGCYSPKTLTYKMNVEGNLGPNGVDIANKYGCAGSYNTATTCDAVNPGASNSNYVNVLTHNTKHVYTFPYSDSGADMSCPVLTNFTVEFTSGSTPQPPPTCTITPPSAINPVSSLTANGVTTATISWPAATTNCNGGISGYNLTVTSTAGGLPIFNQTVGTALTATVPNIPAQTSASYTITVTANAAGAQQPASVSATYPAPEFSTPVITNVTAGKQSATITWNASTDTYPSAGKLNYFLAVGSNPPIEVGNPTGNALVTYKVTHLAQGTYTATVYAVDALGNSSAVSAPSQSFVINTVPTTQCVVNPGTTTFTNVKSTKATITWAAATPAFTGSCKGTPTYTATITAFDGANLPSPASYTGTASAFTPQPTGFSARSRYNVQVVETYPGINGKQKTAGSVSWSAQFTTNSGKYACSMVPSNFNLISPKAHSAAVTWLEPNGLNSCTGGTLSYTASLQSSDGGNIPANYSGVSSSWLAEGLTANSTYTALVTATYIYSDGKKPAVSVTYPVSNPFTTASETPDVFTPATLNAATNVTTNSADLSWIAASDSKKNAGDITYSVNLTGGPGNVLINGTSATLSSLSASTSYTAVLLASDKFNTDVASVPASVTFSTPAAPKQKCVMTAGTASLVGAPTQSSATIQWSPVNTVNCSTIQINDITYNVNVNGTTQTGVTSPLVLTNLNPATTYSVVISAVKGKENSPVTYNTVTFTTPAAPPPPTFNISATWTGQFIVATWPSSSACSSSQVNLGSGMSLRTGPSVFGGMCQASMSVNDIRSGSYTFSVSQNSMQSNSVTCNASSKTCN